jgi:hypothetical protein
LTSSGSSMEPMQQRWVLFSRVAETASLRSISRTSSGAPLCRSFLIPSWSLGRRVFGRAERGHAQVGKSGEAGGGREHEQEMAGGEQ